eukprot:8213928-Pyramimonas_sp.AAC.1
MHGTLVARDSADGRWSLWASWRARLFLAVMRVEKHRRAYFSARVGGRHRNYTVTVARRQWHGATCAYAHPDLDNTPDCGCGAVLARPSIMRALG